VKSRSRWIAWIAAIAYAAIYSWLGIVRYNSYHASYDEGLFTQVLSSAFSGFRSTPEGANHFAFHFSPILYAVAPLLWAFKSPIVLVVVASTACALTIPAIYYLAERRVPPQIAASVAVVAALYPALGGVSFTDFTENVFAPAAAAWLLWAIDGRKILPAASLALLCLCIKEDQALFMAFLGVLGMVYFSRRGEGTWVRFSALLAIVSLVTLLLFISVVRHATGVPYGYPSIRDFYGGSTPWQLVAGLFTPAKLQYLIGALLPLLGLCLLSECMLLALPGLAECLLSRVPVAYTLGQHYAATWVPYVLVAFALGTARMWRRSPRATGALLVLSLAVSAYIDVAASPNDWSANIAPRSASDRALDAFIARLPQDASVTSFARTFAHLGFHPNATLYAETPTEYVILYGDRDFADWEARERRFVQTSRYRLIERVGSLEIYQR
jgi:uncharacterized membrane protein